MRRLVVVVDMINGFCKEGALHDKAILNIVPSMITILEKVENSDRLFVVDMHNASSLEFQSFPPHCVKGTSEAEVIDELKPYTRNDGNRKTMFCYKNSTNAAWSLDFAMLVAEYDEFIIMGCCTDICVMQFAIALRTYCNQHEHDKRIIVPAYATQTYDIPVANTKESNISYEELEASPFLMSTCHPAKLYHQMALNMMHNAGIEIWRTHAEHDLKTLHRSEGE